MKPNVFQQWHRGGFSLLELIIVMAVFVAILGATLPGLAVNKTSAKRISCVNSLKSIGTAFRLYANDHGGLYPFPVAMAAMTNPVPLSAGGSLDTNNPANLWRLFQMAGNELSSPRILVCPSDTRRYAGDFNEGFQLTTASFDHPSAATRLSAIFTD